MTINNELIRSFSPCYDPSEKDIPDSETLPVLEWVNKYRKTVPAYDIIWLLCRNEFMSVRDLRLFAVWCAREALKLIENPDARSIEACNVAERFANGDATTEELYAAWDAACDASDYAWAALDDAYAAERDAAMDSACAAAWAAAGYAAMDSACAAACAAAWAAAGYAARSAKDAKAARSARLAAREAQLNKLLNYFK